MDAGMVVIALVAIIATVAVAVVAIVFGREFRGEMKGNRVAVEVKPDQRK